jgi:hypothetical protein
VDVGVVAGAEVVVPPAGVPPAVPGEPDEPPHPASRIRTAAAPGQASPVRRGNPSATRCGEVRRHRTLSGWLLRHWLLRGWTLNIRVSSSRAR